MKEFKSKYLSSLTFADGMWTDHTGCSWDTIPSYLGHAFDFCGCGMPEETLLYVRERMRALKKISDNNSKQVYDRELSQQLWLELRALFSTEGEYYFFWYRLDNLNMTEHGSSVPGWLTDYGEDILLALEEGLEPYH